LVIYLVNGYQRGFSRVPHGARPLTAACTTHNDELSGTLGFPRADLFHQDEDFLLAVFFKVPTVHSHTLLNMRTTKLSTNLRCDIVSHVVGVAHQAVALASLDEHFVGTVADM
jgi:hypothetical protein